MTQEEKDLLLIDLCARLPYGVKVENISFSEPQIHTLYGKVSDDEFLMLETYKSVGGEDYRRVTDNTHYTGYLEKIKPYLRPMSSMTEEEYEQYRKFSYYGAAGYRNNDYKEMVATPSFEKMDFLNAHHFDHRGLIEKGLAIAALEGIY